MASCNKWSVIRCRFFFTYGSLCVGDCRLNGPRRYLIENTQTHTPQPCIESVDRCSVQERSSSKRYALGVKRWQIWKSTVPWKASVLLVDLAFFFVGSFVKTNLSTAWNSFFHMNRNIMRIAWIYDNVRWKVYAVAGLSGPICTIKWNVFIRKSNYSNIYPIVSISPGSWAFLIPACRIELPISNDSDKPQVIQTRIRSGFISIFVNKNSSIFGFLTQQRLLWNCTQKNMDKKRYIKAWISSYSTWIFKNQ